MTAEPLTRPIRVLFVCTHNSARSQIAEALLGRDEAFATFSAGTEATQVNPLAVRALAEAGIDWADARSKSVTEFLGQPFDYVITVCDHAQETCPVFPGAARTLHWSIDDPSEVAGDDATRMGAFRRTRTEISSRLAAFVEDALRTSAAARAGR
jgi:arsenate reductase